MTLAEDDGEPSPSSSYLRACVTDGKWVGIMSGWPVALIGGAPLHCEEHREMEEALSAARAAGRPLAWDLLRTRLQLTPTEQAVLCMLLAVEVSLDIRAFLGRVNEDERRSAVDVALLSRTVYASSDSPERIVTELSTRGALPRTFPAPDRTLKRFLRPGEVVEPRRACRGYQKGRVRRRLGGSRATRGGAGAVRSAVHGDVDQT